VRAACGGVRVDGQRTEAARGHGAGRGKGRGYDGRVPAAPMVTVVDEVTDPVRWDQLVDSLGGHPLQLWGWGQAKQHGSWRAHRLLVSSEGRTVGVAQVLVRRLPFPFRALSYVPRGPAVAPSDADAPVGHGVGDEVTRAAVCAAVVDWCRRHVGGVGVSFEPDWPAGTRVPLDALVPGPQPVLLARTLVLDLRRSDDELQAAMSKTTRKHIRRAERAEVVCREVSDTELDACLAIYHEVADRAGFALHSDEYYRTVRRELGSRSPVVAAFLDGRPVAFLWFAASGHTAFELYGGASAVGQDVYANSGLKWAAIQAMRDRGVQRYDMNGLLNDGVSAFKRSFADHEDEMVGTLDVPLSRLYPGWVRAVPWAKRALRAVRRR